jgi:glycosyltransferase involved in cell wall biosynthesis
MTNNQPRVPHSVFVTWDPNCGRSEAQCQHLGAELLIIDIGRSIPTVIGHFIRYVLSFAITIWKLARLGPSVIFTENMPIFLVAAVALYAKLSRKPFIIDSHSGAFNDPKWTWSIPAYRRFVRRAAVNINTNSFHKNTVELWGGRSIIIADVPICIDSVAPPTDITRPYLAVVVSYAYDEPISEIFEAARQRRELTFYLTGDQRKLPPGLAHTTPDNVRFTGFSPYPEYLGLLQEAIGVLVLTTRDNTMQRGAYEALSLGVPIITSDFQILRDSFADAALYVDNSPAAIAGAVQDLVDQQSAMRARAQQQRTIRKEQYETALDQIVTLLATNNT